MWKWLLVVLAVIGTWYALPLLWAGVSDVVWHRFTIGGYPVRWIHVITLAVIVAAFKVKGK